MIDKVQLLMLSLSLFPGINLVCSGAIYEYFPNRLIHTEFCLMALIYMI